MTTVSPAPTAGLARRWRDDDAADEPRFRGRLVLADKVVEKVAGQAASEVADAGGHSGGLLGIGGHGDLDARPKVDAALSRDYVDLKISLAVSYPTSIREATQQVRDHVSERVESLTGVRVHRVDIDVTALTVTGNGDRDRKGPLR